MVCVRIGEQEPIAQKSCCSLNFVAWNVCAAHFHQKPSLSSLASRAVQRQNSLDCHTLGGYDARLKHDLRHALSTGHYQLTLANTFYKKRSYSKATYHSTKQCMQLDFAIKCRALFRHCRDAEATGQTDSTSDHKAVIARIEVPMNRKT